MFDLIDLKMPLLSNQADFEIRELKVTIYHNAIALFFITILLILYAIALCVLSG